MAISYIKNRMTVPYHVYGTTEKLFLYVCLLIENKSDQF